MAFIGVAIALLIGLTIYSEITASMDRIIFENQTQVLEKQQEIQENQTDLYWVIIGLLPLILFFTIFRLVGLEISKPKLHLHLKFYLLQFLCLIGLAKKEGGN